MYNLDYYKSIARPEAEFRMGQRVAVETRYKAVYPATVFRIARVWMTVRFDQHGRTEDFHLKNYKSRSGDGSRILVPELEEYESALRQAKTILHNHHIKFDDYDNGLIREQLVFYLADAVREFFVREEEENARETPPTTE